MENVIKILVADDVLEDREKIINWVEGCLSKDRIMIKDFNEWTEAVEEIETQKNGSYDFVLSDILFERQDEGRFAGQLIAEAAIKVDRKTRIFLISSNWGKNEVLQLSSKLPGVRTISKDKDTRQEDFNKPFLEELNKWCEFKCLQLSFDQKETLKSLLTKGVQTGEKEFEVGSEKWQLKNLFPHINWEAGGIVANYQIVISYFIKYPSVNKKSWSDPASINANSPYKLPIKDYYEELYFNPLYVEEIKKIRTNTINFLRFNFKYFVYKTIGDNEKKNDAKKELLNHRSLIGSYTEKLDGENSVGEIEFSTMRSFTRNLTGRLISLGLYLFLDFSNIEIYDLLMEGKYEKKRGVTDSEPQPDPLLSQYFFILGTSSKNGHEKYKKYDKIYLACSDDEKAILNEWWSEMNFWLVNDSNLGRGMQTVTERIEEFINYMPPLKTL